MMGFGLKRYWTGFVLAKSYGVLGTVPIHSQRFRDGVCPRCLWIDLGERATTMRAVERPPILKKAPWDVS